MKSFFENAQRILEVAASGAADGPGEFAVLMSRDGGLRILMNQPFRLDSAAADAGADAAYRVVRSKSGVRVEGQARDGNCILESRAQRPSAAHTGSAGGQRTPQWLFDQPCYRITSPLLTSTASAA